MKRLVIVALSSCTRTRCSGSQSPQAPKPAPTDGKTGASATPSSTATTPNTDPCRSVQRVGHRRRHHRRLRPALPIPALREGHHHRTRRQRQPSTPRIRPGRRTLERRRTASPMRERHSRIREVLLMADTTDLPYTFEVTRLPRPGNGLRAAAASWGGGVVGTGTSQYPSNAAAQAASMASSGIEIVATGLRTRPSQYPLHR